jgi:hypothetical protein
MCKENRGGPRAEFLAKIQTKALRVFLLAIYSHFYSFALRFFFQPSQPLKVSVKENGEYPLHYDFKKIYTETPSLSTLKIMPRNLNEIVRG